MKVEEKAQAINLRKQGWSINSISKEIKISKSTASVWLRDVELTLDQEKKLFENVRAASVLVGRRNRDRWDEKKRQLWNEYCPPLDNPEFMLGLGLYWGEGHKNNDTALCNSDPGILKIFKKWLSDFFPIDYNDLAVSVHHYTPGLDEQIIQYWVNELDVSKSNFNKSLFTVSKAGKNKRKTLPYGTVRIYPRGKEVWKINQKIKKSLFEVGYEKQPIPL